MASHALPTPPCTTCSPPRGFSLPSRLVAAYHTSVKRHSVPAMKSLYVRTRTRQVCMCVCAHARALACTVYACKRVRVTSEYLSLSISLGVHTNYLFRQGVAYRSDGYWPIIRPIFGTDDRIWIFVLRRFFFFHFSFPFLVSVLLPPAIHAYAHEIRRNNARIPLLANISIRDINIADIA